MKKGELTEYELNTLLPLLIRGFKAHIGRENAITSSHIVKSLRVAEYRITRPTVRTLVRHIRQNRLLVGLCSNTEDGYWLEQDPEVLRECIDKLSSRVQEQMDSITALKRDWIEMTSKQSMLIPAVS